MNFNLSANPEGIAASGKKVTMSGAAYADATKNLFAEVDSLRLNWDGADNQEFVNTVYGYKENIDALGKVIDNYGIFLQETGGSLAKLQSDIAQQAGRL